MMSSSFPDNISQIGIIKTLEQISKTLVQIIILKDSISIVRVWATYKVDQSQTTIQNVAKMFEIFGYSPFSFAMSGSYIELFEGFASLKIPRQILCEETLCCLKNIKQFDQNMGFEDSFFQCRTTVAMTGETFSQFRFNYLFESMIDRSLVLYQFVWNLYRFDRYQLFEQHSQKDKSYILAMSECLWMGTELFLCRYSTTTIRLEFYKAVEELQSFLLTPDRLYRFLSSKLVQQFK